MKKLVLLFYFFLTFGAFSQSTLFLEEFNSNPFISGLATTWYTENTSGNCTNWRYEVSTVFDANCSTWANSWPANSTIGNGALIINNGQNQLPTGNTLTIPPRLVYQKNFEAICTDDFPQLSMRAVKRNMSGAADADFTIFLNGISVGQFSLTTMGVSWQNIAPITLSGTCQSGVNSLEIIQDQIPNTVNSHNIDYAFDDILLTVTCCMDTISVEPHGIFDCENPDNPVDLLVLDQNGAHLTTSNYTFSWSNGQTSDVISVTMQDLPIWVNVIDNATGCEYSDSFFVECCIDSIFINYDGDDPCYNPDEPFQLFVYDLNYNLLDPNFWQIMWSDGSSDNNVYVTLQDLPISVTAFNPETGCSYTAVFEVTCCSEELNIVPLPDNPCDNPNDPFQLYVFDQNWNQLYQGQYTFQWSNGITDEFVDVTLADMPISVTVFNTETNCEYTLFYTLDCCPDTVIIEPICLNPCDYPGIQIPFHALNGNGTVLSSSNYTFSWSNNSTNAYSSATSAQLPLTLTVTNNANGCVYTTTYTDPCCSSQISAIVLDPMQGPCNPWGWDIQVVNSFGTQLTSPSYSFSWATGSTSQVESVSYGYNFNIPVIVTDNSNGCIYNSSYIDNCPPDNFNSRDQNSIILSASPNPTSNQINITFSDSRKDSELNDRMQQLVILNAAGTEVYRDVISNDNVKEIDISKFSPGLYLYNLIENNQVIASDKFVKID